MNIARSLVFAVAAFAVLFLIGAIIIGVQLEGWPTQLVG
jgi:hypothetical protein